MEVDGVGWTIRVGPVVGSPSSQVESRGRAVPRRQPQVAIEPQSNARGEA